jgi:hypothetical protein
MGEKITFSYKLFFALLLTGTSASMTNAQNDLTLSFMENIYQASYVNPAAIPVYKLSIGLPAISSVSVQTTNTGFSYGQFVKNERGVKDTTKQYTVDLKGVYPILDNENYFYQGAQTDLFHIKAKVRHYYISVFGQEKVQSRFSYPKVFADIMINGNGDYIGKTADFKNFGYDYDWYRTLGIGIAREFKHWIIGANLKYLGGVANINFDPKNSGIEVKDKYFEMSSKSDMVLNTSGFPQDNDPYFHNQYIDPSGAILPSGFTNFSNMFKNPGAGLDFAVTYKPNDKWNFTASVVNLGFITWKSQVYNRHITGGTDFKGFDVFGYILKGETKPDGEYWDELKNSFQYSTSQNSYTRWLVPQLYLTAKYNVTFKTHISGMVYLEYYKKVRPAFTVSVYHKFGRVFNVVGSYNIQYGTFNNIGLGVMAKAGPFQFYVGGDNLVVPLIRSIAEGFTIDKKVVDPIKTYNLRVGMNLVFGGVNQTNKQAYEEKK